MTADREQVRRDAEMLRDTAGIQCPRLARNCLALLAELEQAERELRLAIERAVNAEQREAALMEALRYYAKTKDSRGAVAGQALTETGER